MLELANDSVGAGDSVTVLAAYPADPALLRDQLRPEVDVRYVARSRRHGLLKYVSLLPWVWRNRFWICSHDILHCHLWYGAVFGSAVTKLRNLSRSRSPAVVETYHAVGMAIPRWHRWIHSRMVMHRDALAMMVNHDYWDRVIASRPLLLWKIIPNGISSVRTSLGSEKPAQYRRDIGIPDECRFVVGTVGMLRRDRRPWDHVPVFAEVARQLGPDVHFVIVGDGPEMERVRSTVVAYGLEGRVHLTGLVTDLQLPLSIMHLFISLNVGRTTGMAAVEAALSGVPIVGIQLVPDYRRDSEDWIWSSSDLVDVGRRAADLIRSPAERRTLSSRQEAYAAEHHSISAMARAYCDLYREALVRRRRVVADA